MARRRPGARRSRPHPPEPVKSRVRCLPIDPAVAKRFRATGDDESGNPLRRMTANDACPCRVCLRDAAIRDSVLLGSYHLRAGRPPALSGGV